jgi:hypothetical protein
MIETFGHRCHQLYRHWRLHVSKPPLSYFMTTFFVKFSLQLKSVVHVISVPIPQSLSQTHILWSLGQDCTPGKYQEIEIDIGWTTYFWSESPTQKQYEVQNLPGANIEGSHHNLRVAKIWD